MIPSHLRVSAQQAPETCGSPCCQANIVDRQKLLSATVFRGCAHCGRSVPGKDRTDEQK